MDLNVVTHEQALSLKELGFREKCLYRYLTSGRLQSNRSFSTYDTPVEVCHLSQSKNKCPELGIDCDAPTLYQVRKWILDKYRYYICILPVTNPDKFYWDIVKPEGGSLCWSSNNFSSPEEALISGITECLKHLKDEENAH